jgi:arylformamidase
MLQKDYPPQEPLSEAGERYSQECWRRGAGIAAEEHAYGADPCQRLLVFPAPAPDGRVMVAWHGGGWTSGYKEWMAFMAPPLAQAGVTLVSAGYRLAPQTVFPAGLEDCIAALSWLHRTLANVGGRAPRFFLSGHSAGGHYAALLSVRRDWQAAAGVPVHIVRGCLPLSGVYDFTEGSGLSVRPRFLGPPGSERPASPLHNLQPPLPPFLVAYGSEDFPHLIKQGERFAEAVAASGGTVQRLVMPGRNHFTAHYAAGEASGPWVPAALAFMA